MIGSFLDSHYWCQTLYDRELAIIGIFRVTSRVVNITLILNPGVRITVNFMQSP